MVGKSTIKLVVVIALTAILTLGAAAAALSFVPGDFLAPGQVRITEVSATSVKNTTSSSFVTIPGLATNVTVPPGKTADLVIQFSGEVNSPDALATQALVDSTVALPGATQIYYGAGVNLGASAHGFNYYLNGVGSGVHRIAIQWHGLGGQQFISMRSMIVIANIH